MAIFNRFFSNRAWACNAELLAGFLKHKDDKNVRKTHLFEGRYENIYLDHGHIPQLSEVISEATRLAAEITHSENLRAGYWFNYMPPASITLPHTHDDDDELLSAAYYIHVPENSGDLILEHGDEKIQLQPKEGEFIFFKPDVRHEVTSNNSNQHRLSIGINFGVVKQDKID